MADGVEKFIQVAFPEKQVLVSVKEYKLLSSLVWFWDIV